MLEAVALEIEIVERNPAFRPVPEKLGEARKAEVTQRTGPDQHARGTESPFPQLFERFKHKADRVDEYAAVGECRRTAETELKPGIFEPGEKLVRKKVRNADQPVQSALADRVFEAREIGKLRVFPVTVAEREHRTLAAVPLQFALKSVGHAPVEHVRRVEQQPGHADRPARQPFRARVADEDADPAARFENTVLHQRFHRPVERCAAEPEVAAQLGLSRNLVARLQLPVPDIAQDSLFRLLRLPAEVLAENHDRSPVIYNP